MSASTQTTPDSPPSDISLKDMVLRAQDWMKYILSKWLILLLAGIVGAGIGIAYAMYKKPMYIAELTFVLEDSKGSSISSYAGLASQFGIDLSGASGSGVFTGDNILEFLKSRLMVEKTLLSPVAVDGKAISIADLYVEMNEMKKGWQNRDDLKNITFPYNKKRNTFSLVQDSLLHIMYQRIIKQNLTVSKPDKKLSFISVTCKSKSETFSKIFTERLVKEATDFYVSTKTQRSKVNVDLLQIKADSIETLLNKKTYSVATSQDMNMNPARSLAGVGTELAARDKVMLQTIYAEVTKNLELSRMTMAQETPIIQIVDSPIFPLEKERLGKLKGLIQGGFIGGFLMMVWLIFRRMMKKLMA